MNVNYETLERVIDHNVAARCIGCGICGIVCSLYHEGDQINPKRSRIATLFIPERLEIIPMVCHFCKDAPCLTSCPVEAIYRDEEKHIMMVDEEKCTGCEACIEACPYGGIRIHPMTGRAMICDHCNGEFACVKYCPENILEFLKTL